jgi:hypothetical protein
MCKLRSTTSEFYLSDLRAKTGHVHFAHNDGGIFWVSKRLRVIGSWSHAIVEKFP